MDQCSNQISKLVIRKPGVSGRLAVLAPLRITDGGGRALSNAYRRGAGGDPLGDGALVTGLSLVGYPRHAGLGIGVFEAVRYSSSALSFAPIRITIVDIQIQVMKPTAAPRDP